MASKGTRKSHKSRKTEPGTAPAGGPSSTALATLQPSDPPTLLPAVEGATPAVVPPAARQWWYRPADSKARKIVEKIVVMREAGRTSAEIAKLLKTTKGSVDQYMYIARKNGWLDAEDEPVDIELELALNVDRKIVRNIDSSLDGNMTNWQTHEMTIAAAKGRGIFKNGEGKNDAAVSMPVVAIQVVMPPLGAGDQLPQIDESQMGGVPAFVEGEAVEGEPEGD